MIISFLKEVVYFFNEISIYLIFGFLMAGVLHVLFPESLVRKHLGRSSLGSVVKSTLFGIPLPLCSCSVVPVATSLQKSGASKGAVVSFLITTPQIGADSFMMTYSLIGWIFALFRIAASAVTALIAGIVINLFDRKDRKKEAKSVATQQISSSYKERLQSIFSYIEYELLGSIANALLIGILIAAVIGALLPDTFFDRYLGSPFLSMLIMLAIGIPIYVCASASTPIAASLLMKGISPGAALVFLLTGPATNAANLSTVIKIVGKKSTAVYLASISLVSLGLGFLLNAVSAHIGIGNIISHHQHELFPAWLKLVGSVTLLTMLIWFYIHAKLLSGRIKPMEKKTNRISFPVKGMTCMHCVGTVQKAAESVSGITNVVVNLQDENIEFDPAPEEVIQDVKKRIEMAGYEV